jgi:hypothetical protein
MVFVNLNWGQWIGDEIKVNDRVDILGKRGGGRF